MRLRQFFIPLTSVLIHPLASAFFTNSNSHLELAASNTLQDQTYLDNYTTAHGDGPLGAVKLLSHWTLSESYRSLSLIDFRTAYYHTIKTNVAGLGYTQRSVFDNGIVNGFYLGLDYTKYDSLQFIQAALGHELEYGQLEARTNVYLPSSSQQEYGGSFTSTLVGMSGGDITLRHHFDQLSVNLMYSHFINSSVKSDLNGWSVGADYHFANQMTVGGRYQTRNGLDSYNEGYQAYLTIPLSKPQSRSNRLQPGLSSEPVSRQLGALIQAKKSECTGADESFSKNGNTFCSTTNPFEGAFLGPLRNAAVADLSVLTNQKDMTSKVGKYNSQQAYIIDHRVHWKSCQIGESALLLFTPKGLLVCGAKDTTIGESGDKLKANLVRSTLFQKHLNGSQARHRLKGIVGFLERISTFASTEASLGANNHHALVLLHGQSFMDFNVADDTALESAGDNLFLSTFKSKKASADGTRDSTMSIATGLLKHETIGGDTAAVTDYAKINNVNVVDGGLVALGANVRVDRSNFMGSSGHQLHAVGGIVEATNTSHMAGSKTKGLVMVHGGAQYTGVGNRYDQTLAEDTGFNGIEVKGTHRTQGDDATNRTKLPGFAVMQSYFKMGTSAAAKKNAISVSALNGTDGANGGLSAVLLQNVVEMPAAVASLVDGTNVRFGDITNATSAKFGSGGNAGVIENTVLMAGMNLNGASTADVTLPTIGFGFGDITEVATGGNYGNGTTNKFPFGLEDTGPAADAWVPANTVTTDLATVTHGNSTSANFATNYEPYVKGMAAKLSTYSTTDIKSSKPGYVFYKDHIGDSKEFATTSDRKLIGLAQVSSRLDTSQVLMASDTGAADQKKLFRLPNAEKAHQTGAVTRTTNAVAAYLAMLSYEKEASRTLVLNKLKTNG